MALCLIRKGGVHGGENVVPIRKILDTLRYCEKYRDLGFRLILDTIFSRLYTIVLFIKMYVNVCMYVQVCAFDFYKGEVCHPQKSRDRDAKKKPII